MKKEFQRAAINSLWGVLASTGLRGTGAGGGGGGQNETVLETPHINLRKELLSFQSNILYLQVNVFLKTTCEPRIHSQEKTCLSGENKEGISELGVKKVKVMINGLNGTMCLYACGVMLIMFKN